MDYELLLGVLLVLVLVLLLLLLLLLSLTHSLSHSFSLVGLPASSNLSGGARVWPSFRAQVVCRARNLSAPPQNGRFLTRAPMHFPFSLLLSVFFTSLALTRSLTHSLDVSLFSLTLSFTPSHTLSHTHCRGQRKFNKPMLPQ